MVEHINLLHKVSSVGHENLITFFCALILFYAKIDEYTEPW
jgi:hypothetical protein